MGCAPGTVSVPRAAAHSFLTAPFQGWAQLAQRCRGERPGARQVQGGGSPRRQYCGPQPHFLKQTHSPAQPRVFSVRKKGSRDWTQRLAPRIQKGSQGQVFGPAAGPGSSFRLCAPWESPAGDLGRVPGPQPGAALAVPGVWAANQRVGDVPLQKTVPQRLLPRREQPSTLAWTPRRRGWALERQSRGWAPCLPQHTEPREAGGVREGALFPAWSTAAMPTRMRPTPYEAPGAAADPAPKHAVDQGSASWWR